MVKEERAPATAGARSSVPCVPDRLKQPVRYAAARDRR